MPLIFRLIKGAPLTFLEGDNNLRYLEGLAVSASNNFSNWTGSSSSQFAGTASLSLTASYALNAGTTVDTGSLVSTASFNAFTSSYNTGSFTGTFNGDLIGTASYVNLSAGPGIIINGLEITSSVRTVNGIFPTNGNIPVALSATITGTSASLASSGSGNITGSIPDGLIWIISNDPTPENNGDVYIYSSGSVGAWYQVAPLDQAASDARYIKLDGANTPMTGDLNMGGNNINNVGTMNGTASYATSASFAISASWAPPTIVDTGSLLTTSSFNNFTSSYYQDSSSFDQRIDNISLDSSSLVTTESFNAFTSSYNTGSFTGSFSGSLYGTASWAKSASFALTASYALNIPVVDLSIYTLTSSFDNFTSSYYQDSSSFDQRINGISFNTSSLVSTASFNAFTSSYNTGSFSGSFTGSLEGTASWARNIAPTNRIVEGNVIASVSTGSNMFTVASASGTYFGVTNTGVVQTVSAPAGNYSMVVNSNAASGGSFGLSVVAGTNSSDVAFRVINKAAITNYLTVRGDGLTALTALDVTSGSVNALRTFPSTGNVFIGSTPVDGGFKLDVNGTTRLQGALNVSTGGATIVGNTTVTGSLNVSGSGRFTDTLTITGSLANRATEITVDSVGFTRLSDGSITSGIWGSGNGQDLTHAARLSHIFTTGAGLKNGTAVFIIHGGTQNVNIGENSNDPNFKLNVSGSGTNGVFNANNVLRVRGSVVSVTGSLDVSGSGRFTNGLTVTGSLNITGSATITDVLTLPFQDPLPSGKPTGSIALSGSGATYAGMFVYDGTNWVTA